MVLPRVGPSCISPERYLSYKSITYLGMGGGRDGSGKKALPCPGFDSGVEENPSSCRTASCRSTFRWPTGEEGAVLDTGPSSPLPPFPDWSSPLLTSLADSPPASISSLKFRRFQTGWWAPDIWEARRRPITRRVQHLISITAARRRRDMVRGSLLSRPHVATRCPPAQLPWVVPRPQALNVFSPTRRPADRFVRLLAPAPSLYVRHWFKPENHFEE